jgi:hypothetical protein
MIFIRTLIGPVSHLFPTYGNLSGYSNHLDSWSIKPTLLRVLIMRGHIRITGTELWQMMVSASRKKHLQEWYWIAVTYTLIYRPNCRCSDYAGCTSCCSDSWKVLSHGYVVLLTI